MAMGVTERIKAKLTEVFSPVRLELVDESALHAGHAGARPEGESHFRLVIVAESFSGRGRLERQRMIYNALGELMTRDIHALSIKALTPDEQA
jgi:BolA protein